MNIQRLSAIVWLVPFISFVTGYYCTSRFFSKTTFSCPNFIGLSLNQAILESGKYDIYLRVINTVTDNTLEPYTIIGQKPFAHEYIKAKQIILCTISTHNNECVCSNYSNKKLPVILPELEKQGIKSIIHSIVHTAPSQLCVAQVPAPGTRTPSPLVELYVATPPAHLYIMPSLIHRSVAQAKQILKEKELTPLLVHAQSISAQHTCTQCVVREQNPPKGTIINSTKAPTIQLLVETASEA